MAHPELGSPIGTRVESLILLTDQVSGDDGGREAERVIEAETAEPVRAVVAVVSAATAGMHRRVKFAAALGVVPGATSHGVSMMIGGVLPHPSPGRRIRPGMNAALVHDESAASADTRTEYDPPPPLK